MGKKMEGQRRRQRQKVFVGVAAVLNFIVICAAFALVSKSLDERKLKRPLQSQFRGEFQSVALKFVPLNCCDNRSLLQFRHDHCFDDHKNDFFGGHDNCSAIW